MFPQAYSAVKDKLKKKTLHIMLDSGDCGGSENLKLIQHSEYDFSKMSY
jgi:hypothetical protein